MHTHKKRNGAGNLELDQAKEFEPDGRIYEKQRDPPGQKSIYILPGDPEKETYRLSTFMKFPQTIPIDVCLLAAHGFLYTGYKDRVKCFSCGINVQDWAVGDDPKSARWHLNGCKLVLGTETLNQPIGGRPVSFDRRMNYDSGYSSFSSSSFSTSSQISRPVIVDRVDSLPGKNHSSVLMADAAMLGTEQHRNNGLQRSPSGEIRLVTSAMTNIQIGNSTTDHNNSAYSNHLNEQVVRQTARVVENNKKPIAIEGLQIANIVSNGHRELIYKRLVLNNEEDRRKSFATWSCNYINVTVNALAKSGFFYLGNLDRVQCFSCSGVLRNWTSNDNVDQEHKRHFPRCKMVLGTESRNIALACSPTEPVIPNKYVRPQIVEPCDPHPQEVEILKKQLPCLHPVNPHMMSEQSRLETFDYRWPSRHVVATKEQIAKAGFYFLGERDRTKCWYCNGGLQNWDPNDEPWTEHAKWFPGCEYLLSRKGAKFVKEILAKHPDLRRPTLRNSRLDYLSGELINSEPALPRQPQIVDPRINQSAGAILQNDIPSTSRSPGSFSNRTSSPTSQTNISKIEKNVEKMGFSKEKIERAKQRSNGASFETVGQLIDAILQLDDKEENSSGSINNEEDTLMQTSVVGGIPKEIKCDNVASLKREGNYEISELQQEERPCKVSKTDLSDDVSQELEQLESNRKCKVCFNQQADAVVIPCGHLSLCNECSQQSKRCPICRTKIQSVIRAYVV